MSAPKYKGSKPAQRAMVSAARERATRVLGGWIQRKLSNRGRGIGPGTHGPSKGPEAQPRRPSGCQRAIRAGRREPGGRAEPSRARLYPAVGSGFPLPRAARSRPHAAPLRLERAPLRRRRCQRRVAEPDTRSRAARCGAACGATCRNPPAGCRRGAPARRYRGSTPPGEPRWRKRAQPAHGALRQRHTCCFLPLRRDSALLRATAALRDCTRRGAAAGAAQERTEARFTGARAATRTPAAKVEAWAIILSGGSVGVAAAGGTRLRRRPRAR